MEPEGETETLEVIALWNEAEGVSVNSECESHHEQTQTTSIGREKEAPGEERVRRLKVRQGK